MLWYWWISIIMYMCGMSFTLGAAIFNDNYVMKDERIVAIITIVFWPLFFIWILATYIWDDKLELWVAPKIAKILNWKSHRAEDKLFYANHLEDKFERSGIKFDEDGNIKR